jgi:hypothetical protein
MDYLAGHLSKGGSGSVYAWFSGALIGCGKDRRSTRAPKEPNTEMPSKFFENRRMPFQMLIFKQTVAADVVCHRCRCMSGLCAAMAPLRKPRLSAAEKTETGYISRPRLWRHWFQDAKANHQ